MQHDLNIAVPFHFDYRGRTALVARADHIRAMLEQLLFTSPGERVNRPDLGSGLMQLVFAPNSPELAATLQFTIQAAIQRWLGDLITLQLLEVTSQDTRLQIVIHYIIRQTNTSQVAQFTQEI